jgi:hypothetical protein
VGEGDRSEAFVAAGHGHVAVAGAIGLAMDLDAACLQVDQPSLAQTRPRVERKLGPAVVEQRRVSDPDDIIRAITLG